MASDQEMWERFGIPAASPRGMQPMPPMYQYGLTFPQSGSPDRMLIPFRGYHNPDFRSNMPILKPGIDRVINNIDFISNPPKQNKGQSSGPTNTYGIRG